MRLAQLAQQTVHLLLAATRVVAQNQVEPEQTDSGEPILVEVGQVRFEDGGLGQDGRGGQGGGGEVGVYPGVAEEAKRLPTPSLRALGGKG